MAAYDKALRDFKAVLAERRAQIDARQRLPERPGQALYLARLQVISTYKDLTDVVPSRIGRPNRFGIPPAYFDADIEPLVEEYAALFAVMQAPPAGAQASKTPFKDVADLARAIARAKGLDAATVDAAGRISLGLFFAETNGNQNIGNAPLQHLHGQLPDRRRGGPERARRLGGDAAEGGGARPRGGRSRRQGDGARRATRDQRFNHWTAVRNGLMNAHAGLFAELPAIMAMLPDPIDQMKLFELIQMSPVPRVPR